MLQRALCGGDRRLTGWVAGVALLAASYVAYGAQTATPNTGQNAGAVRGQGYDTGPDDEGPGEGALSLGGRDPQLCEHRHEAAD